jgi:uncharacterized membrane protein YphA (DoxX/SURF4 family)
MSNIFTRDTNSNKLVLFRFTFLYFLIYIFLNPNNEMEIINWIYKPINNFLHILIPWFSKNVLQLSKEITVFSNGSGDTTYDNTLWFFGVLLSLFGTIIWSFFDKKNTNYPKLYYWISTLIRFYLFYTMMVYGFSKFFKMQFPYPSLLRLEGKIGEMSPMGLAWTFFGQSYGYNLFMGFAEVSAGILVLFRRTSILGSILCFFVMLNVFIINMCFDVPVKLLSLHLVMMSLFLLFPYLKNLFAFFFREKLIKIEKLKFPYSLTKTIQLKNISKIIVVGAILFFSIKDLIKGYRKYGPNAPKAPLTGVYTTKYFVRNNDTLSLLPKDTFAWRNVIVDYEEYAFIVKNSGREEAFKLKIDTINKTINCHSYPDSTGIFNMKYELDSLGLKMYGMHNNDSINMYLKINDNSKYELINRGFHWINEYPANF